MIQSERVYIVQHSTDEQGSESKILGIYTSKKNADKAIAGFKQRTRFCDYPNGFHLDEYNVDKDYWESGFTLE